jgi:osmotically-inducible protein OsmY
VVRASSPRLALDGDITLTGTVSYISQRAAAEATVTGLTGVRNVRNHIEISYIIDRSTST